MLHSHGSQDSQTLLTSVHPRVTNWSTRSYSPASLMALLSSARYCSFCTCCSALCSMGASLLYKLSCYRFLAVSLSYMLPCRGILICQLYRRM